MLTSISEVETVDTQLHDIDYESISKILTDKNIRVAKLFIRGS